MPLFQQSILKKHLKNLPLSKVQKAWQTFITHFQQPEKQANIRKSKEEQYQTGFFQDLFVDVLGYTLHPNVKYDLITEFKNVKNAGKADGTILKAKKPIAVIELKGTKTKNLDEVEKQAFSYKNNQPTTVYIITSNFEKLRFYIGNTVDVEEFNLFTLSFERFKLLWICLAKDNLLRDLPQKMKVDSVEEEEHITKELYKKYATFKHELFENIQKNNPSYDTLLLFKKTQKLLDRFLFLFFAEDKGLIAPNSVRKILIDWNNLRADYNIKIPLYERFQQFFTFLNVGQKDKHHDIFAYNGGLFAPDEILDELEIEDTVLATHTEKISKYDFDSQVSVNILGNIFEHSLTEIEEISAKLSGQPLDKRKSKRKKDGVFYTPKYITKYIVDNTIGRLCKEKQIELAITEADYVPNQSKKQKLLLQKRLKNYRTWLLQLTICDPACGSGAFLNQALEYLISAHAYVDDLENRLLGSSIPLPNIQNQILENNLYGVDINEESVEIAKLSLWLRTAQRGRKLTTLNNNIKCGNSLIDDPKVAGEKAFVWSKEFPHIFEKGGFDVVIGNPPYGAELSEKNFLKEKFKETSFGTIDSYKYFLHQGINILRNNGLLSYIMPDSYLEKEYYEDIRILISKNFQTITNIKLGDDIFNEVNLPTAISIFSNKGYENKEFKYLDISTIEKSIKALSLFNSAKYIKVRPDEINKSFIATPTIIQKKGTKPLIEVYKQVMGVKVYQKGKGLPKQTSFEKKENVFVSKKQTKEFSYPYVSQGIERYYYDDKLEFIKYGKWLAEPRQQEIFDVPKVIIREIVNPRIYATYIERPAIVKNVAAVIVEIDVDYPVLYLLALMNSKLFTYYVMVKSPKRNNKSYPSFSSKLIKNIPIKKTVGQEKQTFIEKANQMLTLHKTFQEKKNRFLRRLQDNFELEKLSKKTKEFYKYDFKTLLKELKKKKIHMPLLEQDKWGGVF